MQLSSINAQQPVYWFICAGSQLLMEGQQPLYGTTIGCQIAELIAPETVVIELGEYQGELAYAITAKAGLLLTFTSIRDVLHDEPFFLMAAKACQLSRFLKTHHYCGQCGQKTGLLTHELATECTTCELVTYPRISPCIIVAIRKKGNVLLARSAHYPEGFYSILAGFVESGETLEQAVHREVMEEVGIQITDLRYIKSQPWPFPHSLMMGFIAEYQQGEICVDGDEIETANWFSYDALPQVPPITTLSGQLIVMAEHSE